MGHNKVVGSLLAFSAAMLPVAAYAQEPAEAPDDGTGSDVIVVTAQRRTELLRDVPQSVTSLEGSELSRLGLQSLQDIATRVPGLTVDSLGGAGRQQITLRGITTGVDVAPTVGIYLDDVPYGATTPTSGAAQLALELGSFDVRRIEILRGPQGTLYGASAFGGVVKYVLEQPDLDALEGTAQLEGSATEDGGFNYGVRAALSAPLIEDKLAARATIVRNRNAGIIDNIATGADDVDRSETTVGRLSLLGKPTPRLTLRATILGQDIDRDGSAQADYDLATGRPMFGDLSQERLVAEPFRQEVRLYSAGGDYDLDFATLTATAGYQTIETSFSADTSRQFVPLLGPLLGSLGVPVNAVGVDGTYDTKKLTLEARLSSPSGRPFEWLFGLFHTEEDSENVQGLVGYNDGIRSPFDIGTFRLPASFEETAAYANGTYYFTPELDATFGIRLSRNKQRFEQFGTGLIASSNPGSTSNDTVATYLASLRYRFGDAGMLYARAASGYRPGGANLVSLDPVTGNPIGDTSYAADTLWNYEIGAKLRPTAWLTLDGSLFYIDWRKIQLFRTVNGLSVLANGGDAVSKGGELAFTVRPRAGWSISGAAAYTDASLDDAAPELGARAGERLPNVARWASSLSTDYTFSVSTSATGRIGASWRYVGGREASFDASVTRPQYHLPAYSSFDLTAGVTLGSWNLDLYARNIFDRRGQAAASTSSAALAGAPVAVTLIQPRTIGLVVSKDF